MATPNIIRSHAPRLPGRRPSSAVHLFGVIIGRRRGPDRKEKSCMRSVRSTSPPTTRIVCGDRWLDRSTSKRKRGACATQFSLVKCVLSPHPGTGLSFQSQKWFNDSPEHQGRQSSTRRLGGSLYSTFGNSIPWTYLNYYLTLAKPYLKGLVQSEQMTHLWATCTCARTSLCPPRS